VICVCGFGVVDKKNVWDVLWSHWCPVMSRSFWSSSKAARRKLEMEHLVSKAAIWDEKPGFEANNLVAIRTP